VIVVYVLIKVAAAVRGPVPPAGSLALFLLVWPGVRTQPFLGRGRPDPSARRLIGQGFLVAALGAGCWVALALSAGRLPPFLVGWAGVFVVLLTFHLGLSDVVTGGLRRAGYPVRRLFADPLASRSLGEFWSIRWNTAFVEMNQVFVVPFLRRCLAGPVSRRVAVAAAGGPDAVWTRGGPVVPASAVPAAVQEAVPAAVQKASGRAWRDAGRLARAGAFLVSGLLHELAISVPVRAGFGLPTVYFALHAVATGIEPRLGVRRWPAPLGRLWTWAWVLVPLPLLFHRAFRDGMVLPLFGASA
jgi:alginate O-acetyltransferase complex protein AlgI